MKIKTDLFEYQRAAVDKLSRLRVGALYMEMGTGKTRVALELVSRRLDAGKVDMVIWLCPCSVKNSLRDDLDKHAEEWQNQITICGIETLSTSVRAYKELYGPTHEKRCFIIVDESNLVKNPFALRSIHITNIASRCPYRLILNGTPISRNEADLFSQWYLLDPRILGYKSYYSFAANHLEYDDNTHRVRRVLNVDYLTEKISPYSVQLKKSDVIKLPAKRTTTRKFYLTQRQWEHYYAVADEFLSSAVLDTDMGSVAIYRALTALAEVVAGRKIISPATKPIQHVPFFLNPLDNPRVDALLGVIGHDLKPDEQCIIWCKYAHDIENVCYALRELGESYATFYGELSLKKRQAELERFRNGVRFLVANKTCAGYGLNLQFCHKAIYYTNDWDWATRAQSEDRIHRIGQQHEVLLIDIYSDAAIDSRILNCLYRKESIAEQFKLRIKSNNAKEWLTAKGDLYDTHRADDSAETQGDTAICGET
jgi:SNF2 family DNA or RNA helicase